MNAQPIDFKDLENTYELRKQTYQIWCNPSDYQPPKKDIFWPIFGIICLSITTFILGILWEKFQSKNQEENDIEENDSVTKIENIVDKQFVD